MTFLYIISQMLQICVSSSNVTIHTPVSLIYPSLCRRMACQYRHTGLSLPGIFPRVPWQFLLMNLLLSHVTLHSCLLMIISSHVTQLLECISNFKPDNNHLAAKYIILLIKY